MTNDKKRLIATSTLIAAFVGYLAGLVYFQFHEQKPEQTEQTKIYLGMTLFVLTMISLAYSKSPLFKDREESSDDLEEGLLDNAQNSVLGEPETGDNQSLVSLEELEEFKPSMLDKVVSFFSCGKKYNSYSPISTDEENERLSAVVSVHDSGNTSPAATEEIELQSLGNNSGLTQ